MREPPRADDVPSPVERTNWTTIALIGGLALLALIVIYFATRGNSDQDKLTNSTVATAPVRGPNPEKLCASGATYDLIKRELFRRAAEVRGSDQAAFDRLSGAAVVRMENPVMESQDSGTGGVNCAGSLSVDLPPGVAVVGGRRSLSADVDYTVAAAADGSGPVVLLKNADAIITPLATLAQINLPAADQSPPVADSNASEPNTQMAPSPQQQPAPSAQPRAPVQPRPVTPQPSFDCSAARTRGELAVCNEPGLAALDRQMASQFSRAFASASPAQREVLRQSAHRFYAYRDRCPSTACMSDAYAGRMREIRDIMEGRWQPR